jgi:uncharacterized protein YndB with AHSA1/START domain
MLPFAAAKGQESATKTAWVSGDELRNWLALGLWPAKDHENPLRENGGGRSEVGSSGAVEAV